MKLLLPLSWPYDAVMRLRNKAFDAGILKQVSAGVPVISVGNLTMGGTGKTPLVEYIARYVLNKGKRVAIVSRGYKRSTTGVLVVSNGRRVFVTADEGGDEPVQMAKKFPDAFVVVGEKRVEAAAKAVGLGAEVILLDDAFQHRYINRDVDIVVIDATADIRCEAVVPAGRLREPVSGVRRATLVAFAITDPATTLLDEQREAIRKYFAGPVIVFRRRISGVRRANDGGEAAIEVVRRMRLLAFSGIGNHDTFVRMLHDEQFACISNMRFADHHRFNDTDVTTLTAFARAMDADGFVTTEKDVVRLGADGDRLRALAAELPVFYLTIEAAVLEGDHLLRSIINDCIGEN